MSETIKRLESKLDAEKASIRIQSAFRNFMAKKNKKSQVTKSLDFPRKLKIETYSIHLMWINKKLIKEQRYINNSQDVKELKEKFFTPVLKWAKANPTAIMNIWYDSATTTQDALKRSQEALLSFNTEDSKPAVINFRDIREIPIVKDNPDVFSDFLPIYFRVDLLKAIIVVDAIERDHHDAAIFSDLEVGDLRPKNDRMGKEELFEALTDVSHDFENLGLILNNDAGRNENQFIQLHNNPAMIHAIKHAVINVNLMRAISALNFKHDHKPMQEDCIQYLACVVYHSIQKDVFAYYEAITKGYQLLVRPDIINKGSERDPWVCYNPNEHGYAPFGLHGFRRCGIVICKNDDECIEISKIFNLAKKEGVGRKVHVRSGNDHYVYAYELPDSDRIPVPPISADGIYSCKLLESNWNVKRCDKRSLKF